MQTIIQYIFITIVSVVAVVYVVKMIRDLVDTKKKTSQDRSSSDAEFDDTPKKKG